MPVVSMRGTVTGRAMPQHRMSHAPPPRVAPRITPRVEHWPLNRFIPSVPHKPVATRVIQTSATPVRLITTPARLTVKAKPRARATKKNMFNAQMKHSMVRPVEYRPGSQNHLVEHGRGLIQHGQQATHNLIRYGQTNQNGPGMNNGHLNALLTRLALVKNTVKKPKPRKPRKSRAKPKGNALGTKI